MLKEKLLRVSIVLIILFTATVYFVTNSKVGSLVENSITVKLDYISNMGMEIIKTRYFGDWNVKDGKLFIGEKQVKGKFGVMNEIKEKTGAFAAIYLGDKIVATSTLDKDMEIKVGSKVSGEVAETVLNKGATYEGVENILDKKYAVRYVPIKNKKGELLGMWFVGMQKSSAVRYAGKIFVMRASIVVISILCGLLGCFLLVLYSRKFLKDIDTHKVAFLENGSNTEKTQNRILVMSLLLIGTFFVIWFTIQGFTIGNVVNNIEKNSIEDRLNDSSKLGYILINELYNGDWSIRDNKLYKGGTSLNDNSTILDKISANTEFLSTIYMGDTSVSTNVLHENGTKSIGAKQTKKVVETVLNKGTEYKGENTVLGKKFISICMPIKDINGEIIGIWDIGVDKKVTNNHLTNLRKNITLISLFASIIAIVSFLFLSIKMMSDISNFNVSLHTNAR